MKELPKPYCHPVILLILALLLSTFSVHAKELNITPLIKNFSYEVFDIETQIWDIDQSDIGIIYAATNAGLYEYDGERWIFNQGGTGSNLRSVLCYKDIIYSSGSGGYGFWTYAQDLTLVYQSLFVQNAREGIPTEEFWNIEMSDGLLFIQSKSNLHIYNIEDNSKIIISSEKGFDNLHKTADNRIIIKDLEKGLCYYQEGQLHVFTETAEMASSISAIFSVGKKLYIASEESGIFIYRNQQFSPVDWEINAILKDEKVYCVETNEHYGILIGTIRHGFYLLDFNGNIIKHYNKKNGLQGNTILSAFVDKSNDIWLGIDGGLSYVQESSPLQIVIDDQEDIGSVYSALKKDDNIYLASNQGLFSMSRNNFNFNLELIEGSIGQTWKLKEIDNKVFVGHHNGAYLLDDKQLTKISDITGTWDFVQSPKDKDLIIGGSYHGISLYSKKNGSWEFVSVIEGFEESSRFLAFDHYGYLWIAHPVKGYYRISLDENYQKCEDVKFFAVRDGALVEPLYISEIDEGLVFYNRYGFHQYNLLEETFDTHSLFKNINDENLPLTALTQVGDFFWYVIYNSIRCFERNGKEIVFHNQSLYMLENHLLGDFTTINPLDDNSVIVGLRDGIALVDPRNMKSENSKPQLLLRQIEKVGIEGTTGLTLDSKSQISLDNKYGNVRFYFASPSDLKYSYEIQYRLTKYQEEWSEWQGQSYLDLIGLSAGDYSLEIRSKDLNNNLSNILTYNVKVAKPYFLRSWLLITYLLLFVFIIWAIVLFFRKRAVNKELKAKQEESIKLELKLEQVEKKALQVEKEKMLLEENQLKSELSRINNDLIAISMNNVKKNDILHDLRECVVNINSISQNPKVINYSGSITSKIDKVLNSQDDWITFELNFKNAHQGFFDRITLKHPELSPNDLKLCAYLRLNLSTKEIASLINISPRSVEVARYRLRQKLQLPTSDNLIKYILEI